MKKILLPPLLVLLTLSLLVSCHTGSASPEEVLGELLSVADPHPAGVTYTSDADPYGMAPRLDGDLVCALYARSDGYCEYGECVESAAVYLGTVADRYFEVAVLACYGSADTEAVAAMCLRRAQLVGRGLGLPSGSTVIVTAGRLVILCISQDPTLAARLADAVK